LLIVFAEEDSELMSVASQQVSLSLLLLLLFIYFIIDSVR